MILTPFWINHQIALSSILDSQSLLGFLLRAGRVGLRSYGWFWQFLAKLIFSPLFSCQFIYDSIQLPLQADKQYNKQGLTLMGNYNNFPSRPNLNFNPSSHEFESTNVQRIKQTPFSYAEPYSIEPPVFTDPVGIRMRDLLQPRVSTHQLFPPSQVVKIAQNVINGLAELQEHGFKAHGDVSTDTIYYDKRTKNFKLTHPIFSPQSAYSLSFQRKRFSSLSPEQLLALTDPYEKQPDLASIKSDLFVFGIILCQICTLLPSNEIYCPDTYVIFDKQIQNRIELIKEYYRGEPQVCEKIVKVINLLLEYDDGKRREPKQILWQLEDNDKRAQLPVINRKLQFPPASNLIRN